MLRRRPATAEVLDWHPRWSVGAVTRRAALAGLLALVILGGCSSASSSPPAVLPVDGAFDYQLGGGYEPPAGVVTVARDRTDEPAAGRFNLCYVNGFQVQPGDEAAWDADLLLRDDAGAPVIDEDWDEALLNPSTDDKRARIATVLDRYVDGCAEQGFDAVELDNLDSHLRSGGRLSPDDAVALLARVAAHAHDVGLLVGQKNAAELVDRREEMGTDFAVTEECSAFDECGIYVDEYGSDVLMVEYTDEDFDTGCDTFGSTHAIVRRDLDLSTPGNDGYTYDTC